MSKFLIQGGQKLNGVISVSGSKNAALPIIAATLLTDQKCVIRNVPKIADIDVMLEILADLGAEIAWIGEHTLEINTKNVKSYTPNPVLVNSIRASVLFMGPLLMRFGKVKIAKPGGCLIGSRPLDTHLEAFADLGATIKNDGKFFNLEIKKIKNSYIALREISVTATENILMASCIASQNVTINLAACEPEVSDLANFLNKMGAAIKGIGSHKLEVSKCKKLKGIDYTIIPDRIEAATFIIAGAVTKGKLLIKNVIPEHLDYVLIKLRNIGVNFRVNKNSIEVLPNSNFKATNIRTDIYPGFATDFQAPISVLLTQSKGKSEIFETLFEGRLNYIHELVKMGANAKLIDKHNAEIYGPTKLVGKKITTLDLRAGATLILAALVAKGTSEIDRIELIDRGYENIEKRLNLVGAKIKRVN